MFDQCMQGQNGIIATHTQQKSLADGILAPIASKMGAADKEKNLLPEEQILFFMSSSHDIGL